MSRPRTDMRNIRQILRLALAEGHSRSRIALATGVPRTTVTDCLARARAAGLTWPLPADLDDGALEARLYRRQGAEQRVTRPLPDWHHIHHELHRPGVTLQLLWIEYKERHPDGYQYSQFAERYRVWARHLRAVMRQSHRGGEKLFVDFAGPTLPILDPRTGVVSRAQVYVAAMGASSYTYLDVLASQSSEEWLAASVRCLEFLGGVPQVLVPDNLKAAVTRAHRFEPQLNRSYEDFADHYQMTILPARPYHPRDKAVAEVAVQVAERWVLARLRNTTLTSVAQARESVAELGEELNDRRFQKRGGGCRRSAFEDLDRPLLRPLPAHRYEYARWSRPKVGIDYHVDVERHYYSVPYTLIGEHVDARLTATTLEVLVRGRRVAVHARSWVRGGHTTLPDHMPSTHRHHAEWTRERVLRWSRETGPQTAAFMARVMQRRHHPEQAFRTCLMLKSLATQYGDERLEAAAERALAIGAYTGRSVASILKRGLDQQPLLTVIPGATTPWHENVRGSTYYRDVGNDGVMDDGDMPTGENEC